MRTRHHPIIAPDSNGHPANVHLSICPVERLAAADTCAQVNSTPNVVAVESDDAGETQTPRLSGEEASLLMNGHAIGLTGDTTIADWLQLIRAEYAEAPGLHLTRPQVQDLWALDPWVCDALLNALVDAGFLRRTSDDAYVRDR
jgi:hypothetical protein